MVNAGLANGRDSRFRPPLFREFLPVLGQIPHIQNPFKNKRIREINRETAHPASRPPGHVLDVWNLLPRPGRGAVDASVPHAWELKRSRIGVPTAKKELPMASNDTTLPQSWNSSWQKVHKPWRRS